MSTFPLAKTRSAIGVAVRKTGPNSTEVTEARRAHAAKRIEVFVSDVISTSPPLTPAQKRQLVAILDADAEVQR